MKCDGCFYLKDEEEELLLLFKYLRKSPSRSALQVALACSGWCHRRQRRRRRRCTLCPLYRCFALDWCMPLCCPHQHAGERGEEDDDDDEGDVVAEEQRALTEKDKKKNNTSQKVITSSTTVSEYKPLKRVPSAAISAATTGNSHHTQPGTPRGGTALTRSRSPM